jgi:hypothetical protein
LSKKLELDHNVLRNGDQELAVTTALNEFGEDPRSSGSVRLAGTNALGVHLRSHFGNRLGELTFGLFGRNVGERFAHAIDDGK